MAYSDDYLSSVLGVGTGWGGLSGNDIAGYSTAATKQIASVPGGATPSVYTPGLPLPTTTTTTTIDPLKTGNVTGGFNMQDLFSKDGMGLVLGGLQTIGSLWGAWKANQLAEKQFDFAKSFAEKNLANQTASYNTALEDRGRSRELGEGRDPQEARDYVARNRLA